MKNVKDKARRREGWRIKTQMKAAAEAEEALKFLFFSALCSCRVGAVARSIHETCIRPFTSIRQTKHSSLGDSISLAAADGDGLIPFSLLARSPLYLR